jgi:hypothetical protein
VANPRVGGGGNELNRKALTFAHLRCIAFAEDELDIDNVAVVEFAPMLGDILQLHHDEGLPGRVE